MRRTWAGLGLTLALAGGPIALAQTAPSSTVIPPPPVVKPGPPGPHVEDPGRLPEAPKTVPDLAYDARVLSSAASAEQFQGPLDGAWTLAAKRRGDLYAFELTDKRSEVEGAWRDLRAPGEPAASGVIDLVRRAPPGLLIRFTPAGQPPVAVQLRPDGRGELEQGGRRLKVTLRRSTP